MTAVKGHSCGNPINGLKIWAIFMGGGGGRLAPMWQQSGTLLFCSCHGIAGFLVDKLQI